MTTTVALVIAISSGALSAARIPEEDIRNSQVHDTDTHFVMPAFQSREDWERRAAFLRQQILASAGLSPMPERGPIHAEVFGKLERNGYTVEKVLLETWPG